MWEHFFRESYSEKCIEVSIEVVVKASIGFKFKADGSVPPQAPAGSALGVNTWVFRGLNTFAQHRNWIRGELLRPLFSLLRKEILAPSP